MFDGWGTLLDQWEWKWRLRAKAEFEFRAFKCQRLFISDRVSLLLTLKPEAWTVVALSHCMVALLGTSHTGPHSVIQSSQ